MQLTSSRTSIQRLKLRRTLLGLAQAKQNAVGRVAPGCAADRMLRSRVPPRTMFMTENKLDRTCLPVCSEDLSLRQYQADDLMKAIKARSRAGRDRRPE